MFPYSLCLTVQHGGVTFAPFSRRTISQSEFQDCCQEIHLFICDTELVFWKQIPNSDWVIHLTKVCELIRVGRHFFARHGVKAKGSKIYSK